jgi:hypothetical protein
MGCHLETDAMCVVEAVDCSDTLSRRRLLVCTFSW